MTTTSIIIRRVRIDEAAQFRDLRLASLQETPDAFASSYEEEEHWTAEFYAERQRSQPDNFIIGAFDNTTLVGMVGFFRERFRKTRHVGIIWGMYVRPEYRRQNIGEKMLHYLLDEARTVQGIERTFGRCVHNISGKIAL